MWVVGLVPVYGLPWMAPWPLPLAQRRAPSSPPSPRLLMPPAIMASSWLRAGLEHSLHSTTQQELPRIQHPSSIHLWPEPRRNCLILSLLKSTAPGCVCVCVGMGGWGKKEAGGAWGTEPHSLCEWKMYLIPLSSPDYAEHTGTTQPIWKLSYMIHQLADFYESMPS